MTPHHWPLVAIGVAGILAGCSRGEPGTASRTRSARDVPAKTAVRTPTAAPHNPVFTTPATPVSLGLQRDETHAVTAIIAPSGGTLADTAADGSRISLRIPAGALLSDEQITLVPLTAATGLPGDATLVAGVQLEPEGLLLLKPAMLSIEPVRPVAADRGIPIAWSGGGEDAHLFPAVPGSGGIRFQVMHFSGVAVASGGDEAVNAFRQRAPKQCSGRYYQQIGEEMAARRRAALMGDTAGIGDLSDRYVKLSESYLTEVIQPMIADLAGNDALLPCAMSELVAWEHHVRLFAGDDIVTSTFGPRIHDAWSALSNGVANAFVKASERCRQRQSPLFQYQRMASALRLLVSRTEESLLPENRVVMMVECGRRVKYRLDLETAIDNVYAQQGRGFDFVSSQTSIKASQVPVVFDEMRSSQIGSPTFTARKAPLQATASAVPRGACPNQVRVSPGSSLDVELTAVLNPRVGRLLCGEGRPRCEPTDVNPGVIVQLAPRVVEETLLHTEGEAGRCTPSSGWNEWMMFWEGSQSTGAFEPFQVSGAPAEVTLVRQGTGRRGYLQLPSIASATARMKVSVRAQDDSLR